MDNTNNIITIKKNTTETDIPSTKPSKLQQTEIVSPFPSETIELPSKGWFYEDSNPLSSGTIELKPMTTKEEDILTSKNLIQKGIVLDKLLESLVVDKSINLSKMLICDRNAVFLAIRKMGYGNDYSVNVNCPRCNSSEDVNIDLSKIQDRPFNFENYPRGKNEFTYTFPISKKNITYKLLTKEDEDLIETEIKKLSKVYQSPPELTTRIKYIITSVEGDTKRNTINLFVDNLLAGDSKSFRKHLSENTPGIDMTFTFNCSSCGYEGRLDVPINVQFFWPY